MRGFGRDENRRDFIPSLISGPNTEIGNLIHQSIELADGRSNLLDVFKTLKDHRENQLKTDWRRKHYFNLAEAVGEAKWIERLSILLTHFGDLPNIDIKGIDQSRSKSEYFQEFDPVRLKWPSTNYEVFVRSETLGVSGRVDRIEMRLPNTVVVTDVKTGEVRGSDGAIKPEYVMQMAAYELLVKEMWPNAIIELMLDADNQYEIKLGEDERADCQNRINLLKDSLGERAKKVVEADSVQRSGRHCLNCPIRHVCSTYRAVLETDGFQSIVGTEDFDKITDGFGSVVKKQVIMGDHVVNVRTGSGRLVQIRSKYDWQVGELKLDQKVYFFNFVPKKNGNRMSAAFGMPSNYSDDFLSGRNWSSEVFLSND